MDRKKIGNDLLNICINKWNRIMTPKQAESIIDYIEGLIESECESQYDRYYGINQN